MNWQKVDMRTDIYENRDLFPCGEIPLAIGYKMSNSIVMLSYLPIRIMYCFSLVLF